MSAQDELRAALADEQCVTDTDGRCTRRSHNHTPTSDGLRDDLARALGTVLGPFTAAMVLETVLPVVEAAVTTATETLRDREGVWRTSAARHRHERDAARGEVAAARTALTQIAALCDREETVGETQHDVETWARVHLPIPIPRPVNLSLPRSHEC